MDLDISSGMLLTAAQAMGLAALGSVALGFLVQSVGWTRRRRQRHAPSAYEMLVAEHFEAIRAREERMIAAANERYAERVLAQQSYRDSRSRSMRMG